MLSIGNKTFMNLQEAVGWLLENNALPFQSTANYVGNTEISNSTLINPSPAKVRIGSLIFFADSKVSTVIGVTSDSFIVSDQYNDLVDDVVYVSGVALDASGHLIVTLSNGNTIDAGLVKQVSGFSIDGSQHLIVSYNDGTSTDLGAIFNGNISISGNLSVTGSITGPSIIQTMSGFSFVAGDIPNTTINFIYAGVVQNGNKITFSLAFEVTRTDTISGSSAIVGAFVIPTAVGSKLYPSNVGGYDILSVIIAQATHNTITYIPLPFRVTKPNDAVVRVQTAYNSDFNALDLNTPYYFRLEQTFLLSDNLAQ